MLNPIVLESQLSTLKPICTDTVAIMSYTIEYWVEVWKRNGSKYYRIKKQIELFPAHNSKLVRMK